MNDQEKISVLLKEYDSLRAHILQRLQNRFQFFTLGGGIAAFAFFKAHDLRPPQMGVLLVGAAVLFAGWYWIGGIVVRLSNHVAGIEKRINALAGDELLSWETRRSKTTILHRIHRTREPCQQDASHGPGTAGAEPGQ